jgi:UDP-N-acetylglucosamine 2-epimerase
MTDSSRKIVTVLGARPQFIKAAVVSRAIRAETGLDERIVHTGQHYDHRMSQVFFDELGLPEPSHDLQIGSGPHGEQTGRMLARLEAVLLEERPHAVLVYGDTNSTLAGALAAAKLRIPVVHVEAGLRSFDRHMPEEINRTVTDTLSSLLLCPTRRAVDQLAGEGITRGVHLIGDVMYDSAMQLAETARQRVDPLRAHGLHPGGYVLMTCHRAANTDDPTRLGQILLAAHRVAETLPVLFPVHPRTRKQLAVVDPPPHPNVGGVQKEAFFFGVPCVTMRDETEWVETIETGANRLAGADTERIVEAARAQLNRTEPLPDAALYYGNGRAAEHAAELIARLVGQPDHEYCRVRETHQY